MFSHSNKLFAVCVVQRSQQSKEYSQQLKLGYSWCKHRDRWCDTAKLAWQLFLVPSRLPSWFCTCTTLIGPWRLFVLVSSFLFLLRYQQTDLQL